MEVLLVVAVNVSIFEVCREVLLEQLSSHIGPRERYSCENRKSEKEQVFEEHRFCFDVIIILTPTLRVYIRGAKRGGRYNYHMFVEFLIDLLSVMVHYAVLHVAVFFDHKFRMNS